MNVMQAELTMERSSGVLLLQLLSDRERINKLMEKEIESLRKEREIMLARDLKQVMLQKEYEEAVRKAEAYRSAAEKAKTYKRERNALAGGGIIAVIVAVIAML
jgi:hypothetical protein